MSFAFAAYIALGIADGLMGLEINAHTETQQLLKGART